MNYFILFNIPKKFKIDNELLCKNFYKLQLEFHPDLFINSPALKKKMILKKSIEINKGYKILKNSLSRAIYLLSLDNIKINKETIFVKNKDFLIKYFSLYEELDSLKKNNFNEKNIIFFSNKIKKKVNQYENQIEIEFDKNNFKKIIQIIGKLLFFKKIQINLKKEQDAYI